MLLRTCFMTVAVIFVLTASIVDCRCGWSCTVDAECEAEKLSTCKDCVSGICTRKTAPPAPTHHHRHHHQPTEGPSCVSICDDDDDCKGSTCSVCVPDNEGNGACMHPNHRPLCGVSCSSDRDCGQTTDDCTGCDFNKNVCVNKNAGCGQCSEDGDCGEYCGICDEGSCIPPGLFIQQRLVK